MFPDFMTACGYQDPEDEQKVRPHWSYPLPYSALTCALFTLAMILYPTVPGHLGDVASGHCGGTRENEAMVLGRR